MEGATDPAVLKDRAFYKMGLFIHDHQKTVMVLGLVSCVLMAGLWTIGADWAEGFGEDDVESVNAGRLISERFASDGDDSGQSFRYVVHHPSLNDSSETWQAGSLKRFLPLPNTPK